ncbi:hypothetical protein [Arthrobacter pigmenti]
MEAGFQALEAFGHPRDQVWVASQGCNSNGDRQVLVIGFCNIEILSGDGDVLLDAGYKEVRGVHCVEGSGVEVWATSASVDDPMRQRCWIHKVSENAAKFLEDRWLTLSPITHSGIGINPLHWREDEYAYSVGRVITEAAKCDVSLTALVVAGRSLLGESTEEIHGQTGKPLANILDQLGRHSKAIADIGERYRGWYDWRNFAAHGVRERDSSGCVTDQVFKVRRRTKGDRSGGEDIVVDAQEQDFRNLALIWHAFYMLNHDAWTARIHLFSPGPPEQVLFKLPMSNSVGEHERLPPKSKSG